MTLNPIRSHPARQHPGETATAGGPVMEIVTYRLVDGIDPDAHLADARATEAYLRKTGAVIRRALTIDEDGVWTDLIEWRSLTAARDAEAEAMTRPEFAAFFGAIDSKTVDMRHAPILWRMD